MVPWGEGLALLSLPSAGPADDLGVLKHNTGDSFRFVREDGGQGTEVSFQRDAAGRVSGYRINGGVTLRQSALD